MAGGRSVFEVRAAFTDGHARQGAGRRSSSGDQRDHQCVEVRRSLDRRSTRIRAEENPLQPLCPLGGKRRLSRVVPRARAGRRATGSSLDRQLGREGPSFGFGRKRREKNQAIGRSRGGRTTKIHALTDAGGLSFVVSDYCPGQERSLEYFSNERERNTFWLSERARSHMK